ncbi:MAG: hypothetical protein JO257_00295 [Deltaproteobacteria bacterium]|nr:hypothetical protein [Deltaproteobacteria bacterium]
MGRIGASLAVLVGLVSVASANPEADKLFEEGRKLVDSDPAAACAKFDQAIKLDPDAPGVLLNLGLCNEKIGKYKSSIYWFVKAQKRSTESGLTDYASAAGEHLQKLAKLVARVNITFAGTPPADAKVRIDGELVAPEDYSQAEVDPGHHTLDAGATGMQIVHQEFDIEANPSGADGKVVTLPPIAFVAGTNTVIIDRGATRRKWAWVGMIGGGTLMAVAGGLSLYELHVYNTCVKQTSGKPPEIDTTRAGCTDVTAQTNKANNAGHVAHVWGTTTFAVGAVAAAVGITLYFTAPDKERVDRTVFVPTVSPDGVGFSWSGRF